jgi:hypothetical protein
MGDEVLLSWSTLFLALFTIVLAIATIKLWRSSHAMATNDVFYSLVERYASAEMLLAVKRLHDFKRYCVAEGKDMHLEYERIMERDFKPVVDPTQSAPSGFDVTVTLHHQRRIVTNFFYYLSTAVHNRMVPRAVALEYFTDLRIIEEILLPLKQDDPKPLSRLVREAADYSQGNRWQRRTTVVLLADVVVFVILLVYVLLRYE